MQVQSQYYTKKPCLKIKIKRNPAKVLYYCAQTRGSSRAPPCFCQCDPVTQLNSAPRHFTSKAPSCRAAGQGGEKLKASFWALSASPSPVACAPLPDSFQLLSMLKSQTGIATTQTRLSSNPGVLSTGASPKVCKSSTFCG